MGILVQLAAYQKGCQMGSKTYLPTLVRILHKGCAYIVKYRATMLVYLPTGGAAALDAVVLACEAFIALVPE